MGILHIGIQHTVQNTCCKTQGRKEKERGSMGDLSIELCPLCPDPCIVNHKYFNTL